MMNLDRIETTREIDLAPELTPYELKKLKERRKGFLGVFLLNLVVGFLIGLLFAGIASVDEANKPAQFHWNTVAMVFLITNLILLVVEAAAWCFGAFDDL